MTACSHLVFRRTGPPAEVLSLETFQPDLRAGQVLGRLLAAPINPADLNFMEGTYGTKPTLPAVAGMEGAGVVETSLSPEFRPGDLVMFLGRAASWASHTVAEASSLFRLPPHIDPLQASMLKVNPATAWRLLCGFRTLQPGEWIVQNAGNSAVGQCVIQLARSLGLRSLSFVRRSKVIEPLRALGADHVFLDEDAGHAAAKERLGEARPALAFNAVGGASALALMNLLAPGGLHITYGAMARKPLTIPNGLLLFKDLHVRGLWISRWLESAPAEEVHATYRRLAGLVAAGNLRQTIDSTHALGDFAAALARLEAPDRNGKVLFRI